MTDRHVGVAKDGSNGSEDRREIVLSVAILPRRAPRGRVPEQVPETVTVSDPLVLRWINGWVVAIFVGVADVALAGVGSTVDRDGMEEAFDALDEAAGRGTPVSSGGGVVAHPLAIIPVIKATIAHPRRGSTI